MYNIIFSCFQIEILSSNKCSKQCVHMSHVGFLSGYTKILMTASLIFYRMGLWWERMLNVESDKSVLLKVPRSIRSVCKNSHNGYAIDGHYVNRYPQTESFNQMAQIIECIPNKWINHSQPANIANAQYQMKDERLVPTIVKPLCKTIDDCQFRVCASKHNLNRIFFYPFLLIWFHCWLFSISSSLILLSLTANKIYKPWAKHRISRHSQDGLFNRFPAKND